MSDEQTTDAREAQICRRLLDGHGLDMYDGNYLLRRLAEAREEVRTLRNDLIKVRGYA